MDMVGPLVDQRREGELTQRGLFEQRIRVYGEVTNDMSYGYKLIK